MPKESDWKYTEEPAQEPGDGQFLIKIPTSARHPRCGGVNEGKSYVPPVEIGAVMRGSRGSRHRLEK